MCTRAASVTPASARFSASQSSFSRANRVFGDRERDPRRSRFSRLLEESVVAGGATEPVYDRFVYRLLGSARNGLLNACRRQAGGTRHTDDDDDDDGDDLCTQRI
ncbi:PREDICTED: uncharacterized protein LOC105456015 [Wasmannia auropunctata]|uniref:uncharacterized protein LOC105456015 n=1 Tax=Wasmannia auropunctata TaxID=64793 RepID=UPI0005EDEB38|nr:PREDICTED: uncharacterized protein LOC105456015 [Wasmannia auropunctata]